METVLERAKRINADVARRLAVVDASLFFLECRADILLQAMQNLKYKLATL